MHPPPPLPLSSLKTEGSKDVNFHRRCLILAILTFFFSHGFFFNLMSWFFSRVNPCVQVRDNTWAASVPREDIITHDVYCYLFADFFFLDRAHTLSYTQRSKSALLPARLKRCPCFFSVQRARACFAYGFIYYFFFPPPRLISLCEKRIGNLYQSKYVL